MSSPSRAVQFTLPAAFAALAVSIYRAWSGPRRAGSGGTLNLPGASGTLILAGASLQWMPLMLRVIR
jgi:hypothetical protein